MDNSIGFFSSFNARHLDAEQVAQSFVPSPKFMQLLGVQNSLLVGARGSGKTHMLKMLQPKALNALDHIDADHIRANIPYWGVFVPADEAWHQQIESSTEFLLENIKKQFRSAVFATHVQRSLIDCFLQLTYDRPSIDSGFALVRLTTGQEAELCGNLAASWKLAPRVHSIAGIRQSLVDRLADLYEAAESDGPLLEVLKNCQRQPIQAALRGINAFDSIINRYEGRWCLMFDELEIAPVEVQHVLFRSLRSTDQKLLFKLALSPSTQAAKIFQEALGPTAGNDFEEISLYSDPREAAVFCEQLWRRISKGTNAQQIPPSAVLGHSIFHGPETIKPYAQGGHWQGASTSLARKDLSYCAFLEHYNIDPFALDKAQPSQKDAVVRKIGPIVGFRDFMIKWNSDLKRTEIRKDKARPAKIYSGWEVLCLVSEGNPRWFTGIAKHLLLRRERSPSRKELSVESQYDALVSASRKFMDYVATIPRPVCSGLSTTEGGLKSLVDILVKLFRSEVLDNDFSLEPVLSFRVDASVPDDIRQAIFDGLYSGAFIPVGDVDRQFAFSHDLTDQNLRTTYLLAPLEFLPLRTGKSRNLSTLLKHFNSGNTRQMIRRNSKTHGIQLLTDPQSKLFNE
ncbi:MAG: hypothetical protein IPK02_22285 [Candidatus Accumulibacter sp.]|uniref:Uncharacterized protein n=1 Tax=Candidatus Accumulibacter affinis TaxID=2954384 RepID=A0A935TDD5_9PROT|nr:hypothetical protein [Candidatus Accumulibacter affinis]